MEFFSRSIENFLMRWKDGINRKPLVLRGARQTGKTTVVNRFALTFPQYIEVNLDRYEDRKLFGTERPFASLIEELFFSRGLRRDIETLLFLDEIQQSPRAIASLRYFFEETPQYKVIATGSLLEHASDTKASFPVGRVSFAYLHPVSFSEYLAAMGEFQTLAAYGEVPVPPYAHEKLLALFHRYALLGGMPEAVRVYAQTKDLQLVSGVYEDLLAAFAGDIEKYRLTAARRDVVSHVFHTMLCQPAERISYNGYGASGYGSVQIKEAFMVLEKAMLCSLVHPLTSVSIPLGPNLKKKPRLHLVDTGMCNHALGIRQNLITLQDLTQSRKGSIAEHLVGQELAALDMDKVQGLHFWVREKNQSSAEMDYVIQHGSRLIPLEVKAGKTGTLRSLMQFMEMSPETCALRLYAGPFSVEPASTNSGRKFRLINIPYYQTGKVHDYIDRFGSGQ